MPILMIADGRSTPSPQIVVSQCHAQGVSVVINLLKRTRIGRIIFILAAALSLVQPSARPAHMVVLEPNERIRLRMVSPIENNTGFRVWGSRYYPGDVLPEKMSDYLFRQMSVIPRLDPSRLDGRTPGTWKNGGYAPGDRIVKINLEQFDHREKDTVGSRIFWDIRLHMYVYDGASGTLIFDSVIQEKDERHYVLYNDALKTEPIYWNTFEKTAYWPAICKALDEALAEITEGYNGFRIVGRIVAKAERVDGSFSVSKKKQDRFYHIDIGRDDSIKIGDILAVTRSSSVRTVDPQNGEIHFPQIVGRVKVVSVKAKDAVVELLKESRDAPIQLGDSVSVPLSTRRDTKSTQRHIDGGL